MHLLAWPHWPGPLVERVPRSRVHTKAHQSAGVGRRAGRGGGPRLEMRLQAMQPLPYHAGLAAHLRRRLPSITALSACSCPLHLSMSGEPLTQTHSSQFLPAVPGIRQCATRRTLAPRRPSRSSSPHSTSEREVGGPLMPCPHSLRGAGPSEGAPSLRLPVLRVHLAVRRCSQRPNIDRMALDFRQSSFRHVMRVSPSNGVSVFSPFPALSAGSCPLALSGSGKPLTQGCPLNPSHLRWGCCMNYRGAPEAIGGRLQAVV